MLIFGDVLATIAILCAIPLTTWALVIACRLIFPIVSLRAADKLGAHPGRLFGLGLVVTLVIGIFGVILTNLPNPIAKLIGIESLSLLLAMSVLGCAGLAQIASERIREKSSELSEYGAYVKGVGFIVVACMSPLVGWLFLAPIAVILSVGAGVASVATRTQPSGAVG